MMQVVKTVQQMSVGDKKGDVAFFEKIREVIEGITKPEELFSVLDGLIFDAVKNGYRKIDVLKFVKGVLENNLCDDCVAYLNKLIEKEEYELDDKYKIWGMDKDEWDPVMELFSLNAIRVLSSRYPIRKNGKIVEKPSDIFRRVIINATIVEVLYMDVVYDKMGKSLVRNMDDEKYDFEELEKRYNITFNIGGKEYLVNRWVIESLYQRYKELNSEGKMRVSFEDVLTLLKEDVLIHRKLEEQMNEEFWLMVGQYFMPNTPALINSARPLGLLSACFVIPIEDSMDSIMMAAYYIAKIQQRGGGTGMDFSKLRPEGDVVSTSGGTSSGPISFLKMLDSVSNVVKQAGVRRGANMGIMRFDHPDIDKFIMAKRDNDGKSVLSSFNLSVGLYEEFWDTLKKRGKYPLINPRDGSVWGYKDAVEMFEQLCKMAWEKADPGVIYFDIINKYNAIPKWGKITATNPCGEQPLHPFESCNLLSINVKKFVKNGVFDWNEFSKVTKIAFRLLNNMLEMNRFPLNVLREVIIKSMRVGLGIMGLADALYELGIPYNSEDGYVFMDKLSQLLLYNAIMESIELAKERGVFSEFKDSVWSNGFIPVRGFEEKNGWVVDWDEVSKLIMKYGIRNSGLTTMPPTGSVSMIADTSSGIEPNFSLVYKKVTTIGEFYYVNKVLERKLVEYGLYNNDLLKKIITNGSLSNIEGVPKELKKVFVTAKEVHYVDHIIAQSIIQRWTTEAVSKTINMIHETTIDDVKLVYILAHELGTKGVTIYRDGSLNYQVYYSNSNNIKPKLSKYGKKILTKVLEENKWIKEIVNMDNLTIDEKKPNILTFQLNIPMKTMPTKKESVNVDYDELKKWIGKKVPDKEKHKINIILKEKELLGTVFCPICWEEKNELNLIVNESGCKVCKVCGWSACTVS